MMQIDSVVVDTLGVVNAIQAVNTTLFWGFLAVCVLLVWVALCLPGDPSGPSLYPIQRQLERISEALERKP